MNAMFQNLLQKAARLTQTGRLAEATQAIQQALRRATGTGAGPTPAPFFRRPAGAGPATSPATTAPVLDGCVFERPRDGVASAEAPVDSGSAIGAFTSASHSHAGLTRAYKLYTPPGAAGQALPLVVMLHGCTQDPDDFAAGTGMNALAQEQGFCVLYPAQSQDANAQRCWNWFKHNHQRRGSGEAALIASMTQAVITAQGLDARRVYIAGLSAGGAMAALVAAAYPEVYAAVGVHSGLAPGAASSLPEALAAMRGGAVGPGLDSLPGLAGAAGLSGLSGLSGLPGLGGPGRRQPGLAPAQPPGATLAVPTIAFHGDQDATVHPNNGEQVIQAALAGSSADAPSVPVSEPGVSPSGRRHTRTVHRSAQGQPLAEHWLLHGAGHAWSGGSAQGSYTDASGPDASRAMWRFFEAQTAPARA